MLKDILKEIEDYKKRTKAQLIQEPYYCPSQINIQFMEEEEIEEDELLIMMEWTKIYIEQFDTEELPVIIFKIVSDETKEDF